MCATRRISILALAALLFHVAPLDAQQPPPSLEPTGGVGPTEEEVFPAPQGGNPPKTLFFGAAISARGNTVLVGMPGYDAEPNMSRSFGRVAVFSRDSSGAWIRTGTLSPLDPQEHDLFGERVALGKRVALVGSRSGVHVFRHDNGSWRQTQKLTAGPGETLDAALAVGRDSAFIGVTAVGEPGMARAYWIDRRGRLHRLQDLIASDSMVGNRFGERLALSGRTLVVAASGDGDRRGAVYVFTSFGPFWLQRQKLIAINGQPGDEFGAAVAMAANRIAIGAPGADRVPFDGSCFAQVGAAYVFARHRNLWFEEQKLARLNGNNSECVSAFGVDVGIGRDWLVVSSASAFAFLLGTPIAYQRTAAGFLPRWALLGDDVNTAVIEMTGSTVFTGFPFDRGFSTGTVPLYDLSAATP